MRTSYFQSYNHLTLEERETIARLYGHCSFASIALIISRSRATIKREVDRNSYRDEQGQLVYDAERAHELSMSRRKGKIKKPIIRGFYYKDRFFPKLWGSPDVLYVPQFGRFRFDPWSVRIKNEYRYRVFKDWWSTPGYKFPSKKEYRFRPLLKSATDYRRKRRRFFFDLWTPFRNWEDKRTGRMRWYSSFRKKYYYIDRRRREGYRKRVPFHDCLWRGMPFELSGTWEERKQKEAVTLPPKRENRSKPVCKTVFHKANQTLQGRGVSGAEIFGPIFKNKPHFFSDSSVLFRKSVNFY